MYMEITHISYFKILNLLFFLNKYINMQKYLFIIHVTMENNIVKQL